MVAVQVQAAAAGGHVHEDLHNFHTMYTQVIFSQHVRFQWIECQVKKEGQQNKASGASSSVVQSRVSVHISLSRQHFHTAAGGHVH